MSTMFNFVAYARQLLVSIGLIKQTSLASLFSNLPSHHRIVISGLDYAGKSSLLRTHLAKSDNDVSELIPWIGFNFEFHRCGNATIQVFDIGGCRHRSVRKMEMSFFRHADAVVWVIDANDIDRAVEAKEELKMALCGDGIREGVPLLLLANKQDLARAWTVKQTRACYIDDISTSINNRPCEVFGVNIQTGQGLIEAFAWLKGAIERRMLHETGVVEKSPVLELRDEVDWIIQEGLRETPKMNEKSG
ncbi:ADP-ribosylation factor [Fusarium albosuccineum]|uniref:ADP-ribosylation factor n=1 Tax=Fusarium albosuccineum TaxID=1237068 RepID=A0A8H4P9T6_9HYPO|nr:ADP-ribosylation factor [Fusarium albosuccineum]